MFVLMQSAKIGKKYWDKLISWHSTCPFHTKIRFEEISLHLTEPDLEPRCTSGFSPKISHHQEGKQEENRVFEALIQVCLSLQWAVLCALYSLSCPEQLWLSSTSVVLKLRLIAFPAIQLSAVSLKCGKQLVQGFGLELAGLTLNKVSKYIEQQLEFGNNQITLSAKLLFQLPAGTSWGAATQLRLAASWIHGLNSGKVPNYLHSVWVTAVAFLSSKVLSLPGFFSHLSLVLVSFWANYNLFLEG